MAASVPTPGSDALLELRGPQVEASRAPGEDAVPRSEEREIER